MIHKNNTTLQVHHIGARNGSGHLGIDARFEDDVHWTFYDADASCIDQLEEQIHGVKKVSVLPYCVGSHNGTVDFHQNFDPNTNSIYPFNEKYRDWYLPTIGPGAVKLDYLLGGACKEERVEQIDIFTLDSLFAQSKINAPDYLSMDVQGAEYDILMGADKLISENVLCVHLEVEFLEMYKGQKLFHHINQHFLENNFEFVKFTSMVNASNFRAPAHARADGFAHSADAVYIKSIEAVLAESAPDTWLKLYKLAMFAVCHHLLEYALECVRQAIRLEPSSSEAENCGYIQFLKKLERAAQSGEKPEVFSDFFSYQSSTERYSANSRKTASDERYHAYLREVVDKIASKNIKQKICLVPNGKITKEFLATNQRSDIAFETFDNSNSTPEVKPLADISPNDIVLITSLSYEKEIKAQLLEEVGVSEQRIFSTGDLREPGVGFLKLMEDDETALEVCLKQAGMDELADKVKYKRLQLSI